MEIPIISSKAKIFQASARQTRPAVLPPVTPIWDIYKQSLTDKEALGAVKEDNERRQILQKRKQFEIQQRIEERMEYWNNIGFAGALEKNRMLNIN